jgi:hypothetical protein
MCVCKVCLHAATCARGRINGVFSPRYGILVCLDWCVVLLPGMPQLSAASCDVHDLAGLCWFDVCY